MGSPSKSRGFVAATVTAASLALLVPANAQFFDLGRPRAIGAAASSSASSLRAMAGAVAAAVSGPRSKVARSATAATASCRSITRSAPAPTQKKPEATTNRRGDGRRDGRLARATGSKKHSPKSPRSASCASIAPMSGLIRYERAARRRVGAGRERNHRGREAQIHRDDGRHQRSPGDPRKRAGRRASAAAAAATKPQAGATGTAERRPRRRAAAAPDRRAAECPSGTPEPAPPPTPEQVAQARARPVRVPHREVGGGLYQAHRRDHRRAEERRRAGDLGRAAVAARRQARARDSAYLNELYRSRAEKAGIIYVDVWDGFVDEAGRFTPQGPDFEGQIRRLRSRRRRLFHQVRRPQARALRRARNPAPHRQPRRSGRAADPGRAGSAAGRQAGRPGARPAVGPVVPLTAAATTVPRSCSAAAARRAAGAIRSGRDPRADQGRAGPGADRPRRRFQLAARQRAADRREPVVLQPTPPSPAAPATATAPAPAGPTTQSKAGQRTTTDGQAPRSRRRSGTVAGAAAAAATRQPPSQPSAAPRAAREPESIARRDLRRWAADRREVAIDRRSAQRGSVVDPIRNLSTACAAWRPSRIAHTTSDWPRRMSPAANTFGFELR